VHAAWIRVGVSGSTAAARPSRRRQRALSLARDVQPHDLMRTQTSNTRTNKRSTSEKSNGQSGRSRAASSEESERIFDLLIADHRLVSAVFDQLKEAIEEDEPDAATCMELLTTIDALLTPHARAEERLIYPAFAQAGDEGKDTVAEAFEEHALVHQLMAEIKALPDVGDEWRAKAKVMMDLVEHHVREEEGEQFEAARKAITREEAIDLGAQFEAGKMEIAEELGLPSPDQLDLPRPKRSAPAKA
jgi:hemerythrin superfamily protein